MGEIWNGKKCHMGLELSFTSYRIDGKFLYVKSGVLSVREEQIPLYRIEDISLKRTLLDRFFKQGSIYIKSSDKTAPLTSLDKIKDYNKVRTLLNERVSNLREKDNSIKEYINGTPNF